jgi:PBSX family phage terminase large subunit
MMSGKTLGALYDNIIRDLVSLNPADLIYKESPRPKMVVPSKDIEIPCVDASNEKSWKKIKGKTLAGWLADEITDHPKNFVNMAHSRCSHAGLVWPKFWSTNPDNQQHFILTDFINNEKLDARTWNFTFEDNPVLSEAFKNELRNSYTGVFYHRFIEGQWVNAEGLVYPNFNRDVHVIEPFAIPESWTVYRAIDFGYKNPFVCLWGATDEDGRLYIFAEHFKSEKLIEYHAARIKEVGYLDADTVADHDSQDRAELKAHDIFTAAANKEVIAGIKAVQSRLMVKGDGKPRIYVFSTCRELIKEFGLYEWDESKEGKAEKEEPRKLNDHGMDALRYMVMRIDRGAGGAAWV